MRKITLFLMSLFLTVGAMAQFESGKYYRIKNSDGTCMNVKNHNWNEGSCGGVNVATANSSNSQNFTFVKSGEGYKVKCKDGYYIKCHKWNVNASTTDENEASVLLFEETEGELKYLIKWVNIHDANRIQYFKVGPDTNGAGNHPYCDAAISAAATWTIEEVYETQEVGNPTEDGVYRIYWKQDNRGYLAYHNSYPTKGVLADVTLGNHGSKHFNSATDPVELEWYLITSDGGNKYLFSAYNGKFLSYSEESADAAKAAYFDAARPCPITIENNTSYSGYYIIKANVDGTDCLLSSGCGTASRTGYPIRWNSNISGDMSDGGSPLIFVKVIDFPVDEAILAQAEAAINDYENPVEANVNFEWTTSTPWTAVEHSAYYTSTVFNDNELDGVKYIEGEVTVGGARTATVTFTYIDGGHKLNIRGVEVIDAMGNIVAGDYNVKTAGGDKVGQVYTVNVAEAGTYKVRCYAAEGGGDQFNMSHGSIVVSFAKLDVMDLTKSVTFAAEYATLYLGYKVAIPAGVEAYVLSGVNASWATLTQLNNVIPANTAVILKGTANSSYKFYYTSSEAEDVEINYLEGSIADRYVQGDAYVLGVFDGEVCLAPAALNQVGNTSFKNNANKAYLKVAPGAALSTSLRFDFDGTTGIEEVEIRNEKEEIYDLTGRRVNEITKAGIYIIGGRKVLVK